MSNLRKTRQTGSQQSSFQKLLGQFMQVPLMSFYYSVEIMVRTLQEIQRISDLSTGAGAGGDNNPSVNTMRGINESSICGGNESLHSTKQTNEEEKKMYDDQDLSGDDLKYVDYSIVFTKPELETPLEEKKQEIINYSTNGGSFGGLKIAKFMKKVAEGKVKRPEIWRENDYPDDAIDEYHWEIPAEDERYVTFDYTVHRRFDKQTEDLERKKLNEIKRMRQSIDKVGDKLSSRADEISNKIGP